MNEVIKENLMSNNNLNIYISTEKKELKSKDLYSLYRQLSNLIGESEVFLFESLAGFEEDSRNSFLGSHKLFEIAFRNNELFVSGNESVVRLIKESLLSNGLTVLFDNKLHLKDGVDIWAFQKKLHALFVFDKDQNLPLFSRGFLATYSYDFSRRIESLPSDFNEKDIMPDIVLSFFQSIFFLDHSEGVLYQSSNKFECKHPVCSIENIDDSSVVNVKKDGFCSSIVTPTVTREEYVGWVNDAMEYIYSGDTYQVQVGHEIIIDSEISVQEVYSNIREQNPSPYMFIAPCFDSILLGASPELFVKNTGDVFIMRPIAGTIRRGATDEEDKMLIEKLKSDKKELAEHLMLIDLCRNDMGRVCRAGSLDENRIMYIEKYSHVSHLVSNIEAKLSENKDVYDIVRATFPAGTMSGAPKVRAMEIIDSLEKTPRNYYAGAIGFIDLSGDSELALMIRMSSYKDSCYSVRASAGIVIDSKPESEWLETIQKMSSMYKAITGKELKNENFTN